MNTEYIPMVLWGKDHWTTLTYMETVMVECGGFQVGLDPRMRSHRVHYRVMYQKCRRPKRPSPQYAGVVMRPEHSTILNDGQQVPNHDDWCCIQDIAHEGLLTIPVDHIQPKIELHLSEKGQVIVAKLRQHLMAGGSFGNFIYRESL